MKSSQKHSFLKVHNSKKLQVYVYKCMIITISIGLQMDRLLDDST